MNNTFSFGQIMGFFSVIGDLINGALGWLWRLFYAIFVLAIGRICDICQLLFRKFAGLDTVRYANKQTDGDIVMALINDKSVQNVFWAMLVLAVLLLLITTFVATIKTEFNKDGKNSKKPVFQGAIRAMANFVLVPVIAMFGMFMGNALLKAIDGATSVSNRTSLSSQIFLVGAYNANRARSYCNITYKTNGQIESVVYTNEGSGSNIQSFGKILVGGETTNTNAGTANFGIFYDNVTAGYTAADKIDDAFSSNLTLTQNDLSSLNASQRSLDYSAQRFYYGGWFFDDIATAGEYGTTDRPSITFSIYNISLVYYYYDLSPIAYDYISSTFSLIVCAYVYITTILGLIKRLFMMVTLFVISPPITALYPLDGGRALGNWRSAFISETLAAYSTVVVMNVFQMLLPLIMKIQLFSRSDLGKNWLLDALLLGGVSIDFMNRIGVMLIVLGALTFFKSATKTISGLIGAGDATGTGIDGVKNMARNTARAVAGVGAAVGAGAILAKGAGKAVGGVANFAKDTKRMGVKNAFANSGKKLKSEMKNFGGKALDVLGAPKDEDGDRHWSLGNLTGNIKNGYNSLSSAVHSVSDPKGTLADAVSGGYHFGAKPKDKDGKAGGGKGGKGSENVMVTDKMRKEKEDAENQKVKDANAAVKQYKKEHKKDKGGKGTAERAKYDAELNKLLKDQTEARNKYAQFQNDVLKANNAKNDKEKKEMEKKLYADQIANAEKEKMREDMAEKARKDKYKQEILKEDPDLLAQEDAAEESAGDYTQPIQKGSIQRQKRRKSKKRR